MNRLRLSLTFVSTILLGVAAATLGACVGDDPEVTRSASPGTPDAATPEAEAGAGASAGDAGSTPAPVWATLTPPLLRLLRPQALSAKLTVDRGEREGEATTPSSISPRASPRTRRPSLQVSRVSTWRSALRTTRRSAIRRRSRSV